jgi:exonuclease SbcD
MPAPIRLLHFADLHVGMENYGRLDPETGISSRIKDFLDRLDEVVDYALAQDADLVIFAGDAFKTRDPDPTQQREFARRLKRLARQIPVFMLVGNHDLPGMIARATSVEIFSTLEVENVTVGRKAGAQVFQTRRGPVFVAWMPFPMRHRLLTQDEHRGASVEELDRHLEEAITHQLADFAHAAAAHIMPRVLVGHFSIKEAKFGSERSVMLGRDLALPVSALADPVWDYVALGHIHKHQNLTAHATGLPPVVYSGSLERIDFGEAVDPKGFCWIMLERGATAWDFVPVHARPFRALTIDAQGEADPTAAVLQAVRARDLTGAVVKIEVRLSEGQEPLFKRREIENALTGTANFLALNVQVERDVRVPGAGLTDRAEALTPFEWTERFLQAKQKDPARVQRLLQAAQELLTESPL